MVLNVDDYLQVPIAYIRFYGAEEAIYLAYLIYKEFKSEVNIINYPSAMTSLNLNYTRQAQIIKSLERRGIIKTKITRVDGKNKKMYTINYEKIELDINEQIVFEGGNYED